MPKKYTSLEEIWENILCKDSERIRSAINSLDSADKKEIILHLEKMAHEEGWHPEQKSSAEYALNILKEMDQDF